VLIAIDRFERDESNEVERLYTEAGKAFGGETMPPQARLASILPFERGNQLRLELR
jgi:hypothetical protein